MASVNKWIGIGNLGQDPEVKYLPSGGAVCNISIACTDTWKDKSTGEKRENTEWVNVVFFNRLAEIVGEHLRKGSKIYVEGNLRTRSWEDNGITKYKTEIVGREMQMLGGKFESNNSGQDYQPNKQAPNGNSQQQQYSQQGHQKQGGSQQNDSAAKNFDNFDDCIPF